MEAAALASFPYYQDVTLPLDCSGIGLNFKLDTSTVSILNTSAIRSTIMTEPYNNLKAAIVSGNTIFAPSSYSNPSYITISGVRYDVVAHAGNGSYGSTCIVQNGATKLVLKEQAPNTSVISEAIINYILNKATRPGAPLFAPQIHKLFLSQRDGRQYLYILMELLKVDGYKFLASCKRENRANAIYHLYDQLGYRLGELYKTFGYTHGDLKPANVMFDSNDNLRLIDFGFSRIERPLLMQLSDFNVTNTESHDLSLLAVLIKHSFNGRILPDQTFIDTIEAGYRCALAAATHGTHVICDGKSIRDIGGVYTHTDLTLNPAGTFAAIEAALVPHRPLPSITSLQGGTRVTRKTKSKRLYRKYARSSKRSFQSVR
jgi:serine/threonine protein kinase